MKVVVLVFVVCVVTVVTVVLVKVDCEVLVLVDLGEN